LLQVGRLLLSTAFSLCARIPVAFPAARFAACLTLFWEFAQDAPGLGVGAFGG
jgi:hypothetical protein